MYFLKTFLVGSTIKVRPLEGQFLSDGSKVDCAKNTTCDKEIRTRYAVGSIFVVDDLELATNFYRAKGDMRVVSDDATGSDKASPEAFARLEELLGRKTKTAAADTSPAKPAKKTYFERLQTNKAYRPPTIEDDGFYVDPETWYLAVRNIKRQENTIFIGDTGTGKTELVQLISQRSGEGGEPMTYCEHDMSNMQDPVAGLLGVHRLKKGGVSVFEYARFTKDIQTENACILLDELNRSPQMASNILFPCLDRRRRLHVEMAGEDDLRMISVADGVTFTATANIGANYTGTQAIDAALMGRFFPIEMDYMKPEHEIAVLKARVGVEGIEASRIVAIANNTRSQYRKQELSAVVSTRETLRASALVKDGFPVTMAMERVFLPLFEGDKNDGTSERGKVLMFIKKA